MIPVFQTRTRLDEEGGPGNCLEACLASILELPREAIPDRGRFQTGEWQAKVADALAAGPEALEELWDGDEPDWLRQGAEDLRRWLARRGLGYLELQIDPAGRGGLTAEALFEIVERDVRGFWIACHRTPAGTTHATVWRGRECVHNPKRGLLGEEGLVGDPLYAWILTCGDPVRVIATGRLGAIGLDDEQASRAYDVFLDASPSPA